MGRGKHEKDDTGSLPKIAAAVALGSTGAIPLVFAAPAHGATLNAAQVAADAKTGCPQLTAAGINIAVKIAYDESSWNTDAVHYNGDGTVDRGLWQINSVHGSLSTFDPIGNAQAMCQISAGGTNWSAWVTYTDGAYLSAPGYSGTVTAAADPPADPPAPKIPGPRQPSWHHATGDVYVVKRGDCLSGIAGRHGTNWQALYEKNRHVVGSNPDLIYPGQVLIL